MAVKVVRRRELTFWEKLYIPQILSGLKITSRALLPEPFSPHGPSVWASSSTFAPSVTFQYPEEPRPLAVAVPQPPPAHRARGGHAPLRGLHALRDGLPGQVHHHRGRRAPRPQRREVPGPLRHRPGSLRLLRLLCRGMPRGRDPHGHGNPRCGGLLPRGDAARHP